MIRALLIYRAYHALNLSLPWESIPKLRAPRRNAALKAFLTAYQRDPSPEHLYLIAIAHWGALLTWENIYKDAALPSEVLDRLELGLKKKKRYLGLWVTTWLKARKKELTLQQEAETVAAWLSEDSYQAPSDPGLRRAIEKALSKLTPKDRQIILWLAEDKDAQEIGVLRKTTWASARKDVTTARESFRAALPKEYQKK